MTDGTGITVADTDQLVISDGGTEKRINASQLKSYIGGYDGDITTIDIDGGTDIWCLSCRCRFIYCRWCRWNK